MAVGRWVPETERVGCAVERYCRAAGVTIRTVALLHPNYARLATGPLFLIPLWATGPQRDQMVARLWFQLAEELYGEAWIETVMVHMLAGAAAPAEAVAAD